MYLGPRVDKGYLLRKNRLLVQEPVLFECAKSPTKEILGILVKKDVIDLFKKEARRKDLIHELLKLVFKL